MPTDFSKMSDQELQAIASTFPGGQSSSNQNITVAPAQGDVVFSGSSGIENLPGRVAVGNVDNQLAVDKQRALIPGSIEEATLKKEAELIATKNIARKDLNIALDSFLAIDESIPRGEGFNRFGKGLNATSQRVGQDTNLGRFTEVHEAAKLSLRVALARMKDSGNLSQTEQTAAEQMVPKIFDDEGVVELKRAFLKQLGMAIDSGSKNLVVELVKKFKTSEAFDEDEHNQMNKTNLDDIFGPDEDVMKAKF